MGALCGLVEQHLPWLEVHGVPLPVVAFNFDGPGLLVRVVAAVNVHDGGDHVGVDPVRVPGQSVASSVDANPVGGRALQGPRRGRPGLMDGFDLVQQLPFALHEAQPKKGAEAQGVGEAGVRDENGDGGQGSVRMLSRPAATPGSAEAKQECTKAQM